MQVVAEEQASVPVVAAMTTAKENGDAKMDVDQSYDRGTKRKADGDVEATSEEKKPRLGTSCRFAEGLISTHSCVMQRKSRLHQRGIAKMRRSSLLVCLLRLPRTISQSCSKT